MTNPALMREIKEVARAHDKAERDLVKARNKLRRVLMKGKKDMTGAELAAAWGKSRQAVYKLFAEKP